MVKIRVVSIDEEFDKSRVKGFTRTRKGKMERVSPYETSKTKTVKDTGLQRSIESLKQSVLDGLQYAEETGMNKTDWVIEHLNRYSESFGLPDNNPVVDAVWSWWKNKK